MLNDTLLFDARAGQFANEQDFEPRSTAPRFEDIETLIVGGGIDSHVSSRRNQLFGTVSYFSDGRAGSHHLKAGGEAIRFLVRETWLSAAPGNVLHVMEGGSPRRALSSRRRHTPRPRVDVFGASDSWRLENRLTLTLESASIATGCSCPRRSIRHRGSSSTPCPT